jgi:hypothetical protein
MATTFVIISGLQSLARAAYTKTGPYGCDGGSTFERKAACGKARSDPWFGILNVVIRRLRSGRWMGLGLALALTLAACHKEEQAVVGVAKTAEKAEQKAQATASERDSELAQLALIPLPTKSMYVDVHEPSAWANPFLSVGVDMLNLRITRADANPSTMGEGTMLRPAAARREELQLRPADLAKAIAAVPPSAWKYGRVIAVAESPYETAKDRPKVRRNLEAAIQQLNDLGIVVEEWPAR